MNYNSDNSAPGTQAQMPNRKGNIGKLSPAHGTGVTAITKPQGSLAQPKGSQGAPSYACATDNTTVGVTGGRKQGVMISRPAAKYGNNDGYKNSDRNNFLK